MPKRSQGKRSFRNLIMKAVIKKSVKYFLILGLFSLPVLVALLVDYFKIPYWEQKVQTRVVIIPKGASIDSIADSLLKLDLIKDKNRFIFWAKTLKKDRLLKAGYFEVPENLNYPQLVNFISTARNKEIRVTLLEGWRIQDIAIALHQHLNINPDRFRSLCYDQSVLQEWGIEAESLEGYLLPDTYYFYWNMNEKEIVDRLVDQCLKILTDSVQRQMDKLEVNRHQILTLASIVEGEAIADDERATIASVYYNRLRRRIKLQADPTIQYILRESPRRLLLKDLEIDSPYNTYKYYGLPPGPINNPGRKSIMAVLYPEQTDYLYFVAKGDGRHTFTRSAAEHAKEKEKFDKVRRDVNRKNRYSKSS
jgi:UPF0755 protein